MSYDPSARKPIPMGILVAKRASTPPEPEPPNPRRKDTSARQLPWLYIAVGGSAAWVIAILVIAFCASSPSSPPPVVAVGGPAAPGQPQPGQPPGQFVPPEVDEFRDIEPVRKPGEPAPKLVRHLPKRNDDAPPDLVVFEEPKPEPVVAKPAPEKPLRKDVNLKVFADCNQIGTDVLFHRDVTEAFERGGKEKKLIFVVHLSGYFEDKDFT